MAKANPNREFPWLTASPVAHRGLFKAGSAYEENSIPAFEAAIENGLAIEMDVRITGDDRVCVYHDPTLERLTEKEWPVEKVGLNMLQELEVGNTGTTIPSLPDVLDLVAGQVPLFIEVKTEHHTNIQYICAGIRHSMEGYLGDVAMMSFDPRVTAWFANYMPHFARGLIVGRDALLSIRSRIATSLHIRKSKPDFLACDINLLPNSLCTKWRDKGKPVLTWTVRTKSHEHVASQHADQIIFERPAGPNGNDH